MIDHKKDNHLRIQKFQKNKIQIDYIVNGRIGKYLYDPEEGVLRYVGQK